MCRIGTQGLYMAWRFSRTGVSSKRETGFRVEGARVGGNAGGHHGDANMSVTNTAVQGDARGCKGVRGGGCKGT